MTIDFDIRESTPDDLGAIERLYQQAFPEEDLIPVVRQLLQRPDDVLSLVASSDGTLMANVIFTTCTAGNSKTNVALLAPLAVTPAHQRKGAGTKIVQHGFERLNQAGIHHVFVLGDPAYYHRFGFTAETNVKPPYPLPDEWAGAWQSVQLGNANHLGTGTITVPEPWLRKELWSP